MRMTRARSCPTAVILALATLLPVGAVQGESLLFIGNSFTYGQGSAVRFYRSATVSDLNHEGIGGVPALFKSFADQAGLDYDVALETRPGAGLDFHLAEKRDLIASRAWDKVVAHGYSTLDAEKPRDPGKLIRTSKGLAELLRQKNPRVELFLTATWSRADQVYPATGAWAGTPVATMAEDVRAAYERAAEAAGAKVSPVGTAWNRAVRAGLADPNPYDGLDAGKLDLWTHDHYHASDYGYYLEALVVFGRVTGLDPRSLGSAECSAFELGFSTAQTEALQRVAAEELATLTDLRLASFETAAAERPTACAPPRRAP
jgi:hypothetical protein